MFAPDRVRLQPLACGPALRLAAAAPMDGCPCGTSRLGCRVASILSYDCVLLDSLLNWGAIVIIMLGGTLLLRPGRTWWFAHGGSQMAAPSRPPHTGLVHFACATAFYWFFQLGLCLSLYDETDSHESRCTGVSIVWSAQAGRYVERTAGSAFGQLAVYRR